MGTVPGRGQSPVCSYPRLCGTWCFHATPSARARTRRTTSRSTPVRCAASSGGHPQIEHRHERPVGVVVGEAELVLVGLPAPEPCRRMLVEHRLGLPQHPRRRPHLGLVEVGDRLDIRRRVAEPGEVAEQVLGAILGADDERVQLLGEVVDHDHARPRAGVPLPDRRLPQRRARRRQARRSAGRSTRSAGSARAVPPPGPTPRRRRRAPARCAATAAAPPRRARGRAHARPAPSPPPSRSRPRGRSPPSPARRRASPRAAAPPFARAPARARPRRVAAPPCPAGRPPPATSRSARAPSPGCRSTAATASVSTVVRKPSATASRAVARTQ